jgi:hypothetical protein
MAVRVIFLIFPILLLNAAPAAAQTFGSVLCKASLRKLNDDLGGSQRRVETTANAATETKCEALNVRKFVLEEAVRVYGRCMDGSALEEKLTQTKNSAAEIRIEIERTCGG